MSKTVKIEGDVPLIGSVKVQGSPRSCLNLIVASIFCSETVVLENVPKSHRVLKFLEIYQSLGGVCEWISSSKLYLNSQNITNFIVDAKFGNDRLYALFSAPLLFKFGKAKIPKPSNLKSIDKVTETWKALGVVIKQEKKYFVLSLNSERSDMYSFSEVSHVGTNIAILLAIFSNSETLINNISQEPEVEDLINFCNLIGSNITFFEANNLKIIGTTKFTGCNFFIRYDHVEVISFCVLALVTQGNITIEDVIKSDILSFINKLSRMDFNFEFTGRDLRVWNNISNNPSIDINVSSFPGFLHEWIPSMVVLLLKTSGISVVNDSFLDESLAFVKDLNLLEANIDILNKTNTAISIKAPVTLKSNRLETSEIKLLKAFTLACLCAKGTSEISFPDDFYEEFEVFVRKLVQLGAKIELL